MSELLDTLVRLASLGASGISIFVIFWIGWLLLRLPSGADRERHKTLRLFMLVCFGIALIAGGTGLANVMIKADQISKLNRTIIERNQTIIENREEIDKYKNLQSTARGSVNALKSIVKSKQLAAAASGSVEIERQVQTLKDVIKQLIESLTPI